MKKKVNCSNKISCYILLASDTDICQKLKNDAFKQYLAIGEAIQPRHEATIGRVDVLLLPSIL